MTVMVTLPDPYHASLAGICNDGTAVRVVGDGTRIALVDTVTCASAMSPQCPTATLVITELSAELFAGDSLNITASGTIGGCDAPMAPLQFTFDGTREVQ